MVYGEYALLNYAVGLMLMIIFMVIVTYRERNSIKALRQNS